MLGMTGSTRRGEIPRSARNDIITVIPAKAGIQKGGGDHAHHSHITAIMVQNLEIYTPSGPHPCIKSGRLANVRSAAILLRYRSAL